MRKRVLNILRKIVDKLGEVYNRLNSHERDIVTLDEFTDELDKEVEEIRSEVNGLKTKLNNFIDIYKSVVQ